VSSEALRFQSPGMLGCVVGQVVLDVSKAFTFIVRIKQSKKCVLDGSWNTLCNAACSFIKLFKPSDYYLYRYV